MTMKPAALEDLRILELADESGQHCGKLFADMGANVIKIEKPGGDDARRVGPFLNDIPDPNRSLFFWHYNTSKKGITLNLETVDGREILKKLVKTADVILETFPPGHLNQLGLGYPILREINPKLIMTSLTPFGQTGPYKQYKSSDLVSLALGGPMNSCGYDDIPGVPPIRGGGNQGYQTGGHYAFIGTLIALIYRQMTGRGQYIDASAHEALACTTEFSTISYFYIQRLVKRQTGRHASLQDTGNNDCLCKDGRWAKIYGFRDEAAWDALVEWMESEGMAGDLKDEQYKNPAYRTEENEHIMELINAFAQHHTSEEFWEKAKPKGTVIGFPIRSPEEMAEDPHHKSRGFTFEVEHPELGKTFKYPGSPYLFHGTPWRITRRAPLIGEHNEEIYMGELGFTKVELTMLAEGEVI
ncbi:MAG: CoA transferase [Candidatus Tectomicrobia bacterium]|nr:CoA transferase [Candidatus Tectomicrobia bacterium]